MVTQMVMHTADALSAPQHRLLHYSTSNVILPKNKGPLTVRFPKKEYLFVCLFGAIAVFVYFFFEMGLHYSKFGFWFLAAYI